MKLLNLLRCLILWSKEKGWARHSTFGLRYEWLSMYLNDPKDWRNHCLLGNKQIESLNSWLKTAGLEDRHGQLTSLGRQFNDKGIDFDPLWEILWTNVVFNFPTARWYAHLGCGEWTTKELKVLLNTEVSILADRTVSNAVVELTSLLERTPVGDELGQGSVTKGMPRRIKRFGLAAPCDAAIVHALRRLYLQEGQRKLFWNENLTWPWVVFGCSRQFIMERITTMDKTFFDFDEQYMIMRNDEEWYDVAIF